ncbi:tripartite tricarboxylate transporter permease [Devosia ginsengisoli]|uniref:tripartite tricarboxylate transporter permease n=1 Tax=Devosia ginsengisoli TaxID=400770 RepID=UPI0026EAA145|nr:tripartite tricarboxylate transporter permease [Devosia ginsengisoli]MCR6670715.1 tripartite tricarboxylate transporter permease [Devosia ginsengisoli]
MDMLGNLALGFATATTPEHLIFCFVGALLGTLIGILPGVGPTATIAMLLPITFTLPPTASLIMLAGIYYGAQYGGSTTAILINLPGEASSAVTAIDGYQMARQGRAGPALAIAAIGSFAAGTIATLLVAAFAPVLTLVAIEFGPAEYFSLITVGLVCSIALAHGSVLRALAMVVLGLLLSVIGTDVYSGLPRLNFGLIELSTGINVIAVAVGIFGVAEILRNLGGGDERSGEINKIGKLMPTKHDLKQSTAPILRGTAIGSVLGILPGGGALLSSFASYALEKRLSRNPERFGHGAIEAVAGPESANNAGAQTSFIPMLTLGIPSNPVMALMLGAMLIQGIAPGPSVITTRPELFWGLIASMWIGNLMLLVLNLPLVGLWIRLLKVPYEALFPAIIIFSAIGTYAINGSAFDLYQISLFGVLGYMLYRLRCEPAPLLLGFVLGPLLEENLRRAMMMSRGNPAIFFDRPISLGLLLVAVALLVVSVLPMMVRRRKEIFVED